MKNPTALRLGDDGPRYQRVLVVLRAAFWASAFALLWVWLASAGQVRAYPYG